MKTIVIIIIWGLYLLLFSGYVYLFGNTNILFPEKYWEYIWLIFSFAAVVILFIVCIYYSIIIYETY